MPGLPATGELSYNGYTFDGAAHITAAAKPIRDEANRVTVGVEYSITVEAIIADDDGTDNTLEDIRQRLTEIGGPLKFTNKGFGDDLIVLKGDIQGGPQPEELAWDPIADDKAAEVSWRIKVVVAECLVGSPKSSGIKALNWGAEYHINEHGGTTRKLSGYLEIVVRVAAASTDTADRYREKFAAAAIPGFKRQQSWELSPDRSRLDFTITDTQIPSPNPYPAGATDIQGTHRVALSKPIRGRPQVRNLLSLSITPRSGIPGSQALALFIVFLRQRLLYAHRRGRVIWIDSMAMEESLFSRTHSFSASYTFLNGIGHFLQSGLWQPLGTDWTKWVTSLADTAIHPRGSARLADIAANDVVVSLCSPPDTVYPNNKHANILTPIVHPVIRKLSNNKPPKDKSFRSYRSVVMPSAEHDSQQQKILQKPSEDTSYSPLDKLWQGDNFNTGEDGAQAKPAVIQTGSNPTRRITFVGEAERAGYPVPRPKVERVGSQVAYPRSERFSQEIVSNSFGVPLYKAAWVLEYDLVSAPGVIKIPKKINEDDTK